LVKSYKERVVLIAHRYGGREGGREGGFTTIMIWSGTYTLLPSSLPPSLPFLSYGSNVILYFFAWVESANGGNRGKKWCEIHIATFVNIAGPLLGVVKSASAYVSGEMHDTGTEGGRDGGRHIATL